MEAECMAGQRDSLRVDSSETTVNLDVSTLIAWVSEITHRCPRDHLENKFLNQQAHDEMRAPVLPVLMEVTKGRHMIVCQAAVDRFMSIVSSLGGPMELQRARELLEHIEVVPDEPSKKVMELKENKQIKHLAKIVFGTGYTRNTITLTSNERFLRVAERQGIELKYYLHQPRSLAELKL